MQESLVDYNSLDYEYNITFISYNGFLVFEGQKLDYSNSTFSFNTVNEELISSEISTEVSETSSGTLSVSII
jgi:hypothetical protein